MNRLQFAAAIRRDLADHAAPAPDSLLAALLASCDEYAAHLVEQHARPVARVRTARRTA